MTPPETATVASPVEDEPQAPDVSARRDGRDPHSGERSAKGWLETKGILTTVVLLVVFDMAVVTRHALIDSRIIVVGLGLFLPGASVLAATRVRLTNPFSHLVGVFGTGAAVWMAWVVASSATLPPSGVRHPLDALPLTVGINMVVLVALLFRPHGVDPVWDLLRSDGKRPSVIVGLAGALLPLSAVAAAERLNGGFGGAAAVAVSIAALGVLVLVMVKAPHWADGRVQYLLFTTGLALIYLYTWRSNHLFGFDVQQEYQRFTFTLGTGRWVPPTNGDPYSAMLSITALPAALVKVSGLSGLTLFKGLYPLFLATVPPLTYGLVRVWLSPRPAAVSAAYLIALSQFAGQLSEISRQEVGLCYFGLLVVVLFDPLLTPRRRTGVAVAALGALVVSHYSTSYITVYVLVATWILFGLVRLLQRGSPPTEVGRPGHGGRGWCRRVVHLALGRGDHSFGAQPRVYRHSVRRQRSQPSAEPEQLGAHHVAEWQRRLLGFTGRVLPSRVPGQPHRALAPPLPHLLDGTVPSHLCPAGRDICHGPLRPAVGSGQRAVPGRYGRRCRPSAGS